MVESCQLKWRSSVLTWGWCGHQKMFTGCKPSDNAPKKSFWWGCLCPAQILDKCSVSSMYYLPPWKKKPQTNVSLWLWDFSLSTEMPTLLPLAFTAGCHKPLNAMQCSQHCTVPWDLHPVWFLPNEALIRGQNSVVSLICPISVQQ